MTYQNIMIDRISTILRSVQCDDCQFKFECWNEHKGNYCKEMEDWLNEQYI